MGVRFVVRSAEGKALAEELSYGFEQGRVVIGRGAGADVRIPHPTVSEVHATVRLEREGYAITDNDSTNGTRVNGVKIALGRSKRLRDGDRIEIGVYTLTFQAGVALAETVTAERTAELARRLFRQSQRGSSVGGPRLVVLSGAGIGRYLAVPPPPARLLIGRADGCQLVLPDPELAEEHAEVVPDLDGVLLRALPGGTLEVNHQPVTQRRLRDADEIVLGQTRLLFEEPAEEPIEGLAGEPDRPLPPEPPPAEPPATKGDEPPVAAAAAAAPAAARRAPRRGFDADVIIYTLAAIVIAVSIAGLVALMSAD